MYLVEHRHGDNATHAGNRLQSKEVVRVVDFGRLFDESFEFADVVIVMREHFQIGLDAEGNCRIGEDFGDALTIAGIL